MRDREGSVYFSGVCLRGFGVDDPNLVVLVHEVKAGVWHEVVRTYSWRSEVICLGHYASTREGYASGIKDVRRPTVMGDVHRGTWCEHSVRSCLGGALGRVLHRDTSEGGATTVRMYYGKFVDRTR